MYSITVPARIWTFSRPGRNTVAENSELLLWLHKRVQRALDH